MPSERRVVAFRPDDKEAEMLKMLAEKYGLPETRVLGQALRKWAEEESKRIGEDFENVRMDRRGGDRF